MVVYLSGLALRQIGDLSRVYPTSHPVTAGIGSSVPRVPEKDKQKRMDGWLDGCLVLHVLLKRVKPKIRR